jgi:EAL domain-containing protein (putative c-di-GMP-specific phosphodiesterase class I)
LTYSSVADELLASIVASRDLLSVEITESALADSRAQRTLRDLAGAGVSCAIDDFGTGYSSLAALSSLPVDTLKIDRAFVLDIDRSDQAFAVIRSVVQLADALTLHVIAEGVETAQIAGRLQQAGIRLAQGYLYARPMPAADVVPWLDSYAQGRLATAP